jgi:hypothetical protein
MAWFPGAKSDLDSAKVVKEFKKRWLTNSTTYPLSKAQKKVFMNRAEPLKNATQNVKSRL